MMAEVEITVPEFGVEIGTPFVSKDCPAPDPQDCDPASITIINSLEDTVLAFEAPSGEPTKQAVPDVAVQKVDSADNQLGTPVLFPPNAAVTPYNMPIPDTIVQLNSDAIGSVLAGKIPNLILQDEGENPVIPLAVVQDAINFIATLKMGVDISEGDAAEADVLAPRKFFSAAGPLKTGTMPDRGTVNTEISTKAQVVTIESGKHSGAGTVQISAEELAKIIPENIKKDVVILGEPGIHEGDGGSAYPTLRMAREHLAFPDAVQAALSYDSTWQTGVNHFFGHDYIHCSGQGYATASGYFTHAHVASTKEAIFPDGVCIDMRTYDPVTKTARIKTLEALGTTDWNSAEAAIAEFPGYGLVAGRWGLWKVDEFYSTSRGRTSTAVGGNNTAFNFNPFNLPSGTIWLADRGGDAPSFRLRGNFGSLAAESITRTSSEPYFGAATINLETELIV